MPDPINITQIPAPRVEVIDSRTGLMSREWFRFFNNIYTIVGANLGIIQIPNGGTGLSTYPTNGQLLIGDTAGEKYVLNTLTAGSGIGVTNGAGTIGVANTGVLSNVAGAGISVSSATGNVTVANTGVLSVTAGTGISVTATTGAITVANTGVLSFNGGSTGLTPNTATTGAVTLAGILNVTNGGTGVTSSTGTSKTVLSSLPTFNTTIGVGGATASSSGSGVSFPATQSASTNANTLDDYEEGTWTPTNPQVSITVTSAVYTKIGNLVNYQTRVTFGANVDTNPASIVGFPFTPAAYDFPALIFSDSGTGTSGFMPGAAQLLFYTINQSAILTNAQLAGVTLRITGFYFV